MADTWMTPTRKNDLLKYVDELKKMSGGPVDEEDLYAAGFSEKDLDEIGWFKPNPKASTMAGDGSKLDVYTPTSRDNVRTNVLGLAQGLGLDKQLARSIAVKVAGEENPADGGMGMGLADFTPLGALFGAEEGVGAVKRGVASGDYTSAGLGALGAVTSVASAIPGGKAVSQGVNKLAEKLAGQYDPSVVRTFFGPNSVKADLGKLRKAEELAASGADEQTVWQETGWWNGPNGWRFEVDDSEMQLPLGSSQMDMHGNTEAAVVHKDFWGALRPNPDAPEEVFPTDDFYNHQSRKIDVSEGQTSFGPMDAGKDYKGAFNPADASVKAYGYTQSDQKETLVHELQHAIQYVFGDKGTGSNPASISRSLKETLEALPYDHENAAGAATEIGYSTARLESIDTTIAGLEARIAKEAALNEDDLVNSINSSGEIPFGWGKIDTGASDKETLEALYNERELLTERIRDYSSYLDQVKKAYPDFSQAVDEFQILGKGIGSQFFVTTGVEDLLSKKNVFKSSGELEDFASHTLYTLDAGEVEARVAGDRAHWSAEDRANVVPSTDVIDKNYIYTQDDLANWLAGVEADSRKKKGYAKGGVVQEVDPVSGNAVPPGAEPKEVRDDIDAKLSDGEYVIPADVVRYLGLDKIEKLVAQAKEGLAEMDKQGRIGGEDVPAEDDLPFSDEELGEVLPDDEEVEPVHMAMGGMVSAGDRIRNNAGIPNSPTNQPQNSLLPPWMTDTPQNEASPQRDNWADKQAEKTPMGMAGAVETWRAKDFSSAVKQRSGDPGTQVIEKMVSTIPFGGLAMRARNKYLDKKVPGAIDAMLKAGKDVDGTPLTEQQIADLQQAKTDFTETIGYKPTGLKGLIKDTVKSIIKPRETPAKATGKPAEKQRKDSASDKTPSKDTKSSSSRDKKDDKKK